MSIDILSLEWPKLKRDINIVEPILSYLEMKYGLKVKRKNYVNYKYYLYKYKPKIVILSNPRGAINLLNALKYSKNMGFYAVTLMVEGIFREMEKKKVIQSTYGLDKEQSHIEDLHLQWSERNLKLMNKYIKDIQNEKIKVCGATGFDKYKIFDFLVKTDFIKKYDKEKYEKVIGLAGWSFSIFLGSYFEKKKQILEKLFTDKDIEIFRKSKDLLHSIYKKLIINNPDVLFILKCHPIEPSIELSELYGLDKFSNTIFIQHEEDIGDLINVSDLWIAFESTTSMEAWLLGKQSMFINPVSKDFSRAMIYKGHPVFETYEQAQEAIDDFYDTGILKGFDKLEKQRQKIIESTIQYGDGKNHIRAGEYIFELYNKVKNQHKNYKFSFFEIFKFVIKFLVLKLKFINRLIIKSPLKKIKKINDSFRYAVESEKLFDPKERYRYVKRYKKYLKKFYKKNGIDYN